MHDDLDFALDLADVADAVTVPRFRALDLKVEQKPDLTPVSDADRAAEEAIRARIATGRPEHAVVGEELSLGEDFGAGDSIAVPRWIVDPIDGTKNFVRGIPVWATLIALEDDDGIAVAVVSAPALGRRWSAVRGKGAWADGERCAVSSVAAVEDAAVSTTSAPQMPAGWAGLAAQAWAARGWSDFWQHCLVAEGSLDIATDPVVNLWDYAAIALIVTEAGGRCTTFTGGAPEHGASLLSTNGALHDVAVSALG